MKTIDELQLEMDGIAARINAELYRREVTIPTEEPTPGEPWYEIEDGKYYIKRRGERSGVVRSTLIENENEFLYKRTRLLIHRVASDWEIQHRQWGVDFRRMLFAKQLELFGLVNKQWQQRMSADFESILRQHPFNDTDN